MLIPSLPRHRARPALRVLLCAGIGIGLAYVVAVTALAGSASAVLSAQPYNPFAPQPPTYTVYLPIVDKPLGNVPYCRVGVGVASDIAQYNIAPLHLGWYVDWTVLANPSRPLGIEYMPTVRLRQAGSGYTATPTGTALLAAIDENPGSVWIIGNEPDRKYFEDDLEPPVYAQAYHDLYYLIKGRDPTARIAAGSIVQPTPIRLQYLDAVLTSYLAHYGAAMPVDVWNTHNFILNEVDCNYDPGNCWGADVPPGINVPYGERYSIQDNDNFDVFKRHVIALRQWMADRGYRDAALIITEFGVEMPADYGFGPDRVNAYMDKTFGFLSAAADPAIGLPADKNRLVQQWAWYSLTDTSFNGWLFDPTTKSPTVFGNHYAAITSAFTPTINLAPVKLWVEPASPAGAPVTLTLYALIVNNGNMRMFTSAQVRFYDGDPQQGGVQITPEQTLPALGGCANSSSAHAVWRNVSAGVHQVYVVVDPWNSIIESDKTDNIYSIPITVTN